MNIENKRILVTGGNGFLGKGTHVVIEVAKLLLTNKLIKFIIVSASLPKEVRLPSNVELVSTQYMSKTQRNEIYLKSDLMLFPVFQDSFGVYLEAISYGMPILSNNIYDKNELVENGVTGYLIDTPISLWDGNVGVDYKNWSEFQELILKFNGTSKFRQMIESYVEKLLYLEKNRSVYKKMSIDTSNLCIDRFSPSKRTLKLSHLYNALD